MVWYGRRWRYWLFTGNNTQYSISRYNKLLRKPDRGYLRKSPHGYCRGYKPFSIRTDDDYTRLLPEPDCCRPYSDTVCWGHAQLVWHGRNGRNRVNNSHPAQH